MARRSHCFFVNHGFVHMLFTLVVNVVRGRGWPVWGQWASGRPHPPLSALRRKKSRKKSKNHFLEFHLVTVTKGI